MGNLLFKIIMMPLAMAFVTYVAFVLIAASVCDMTGKCDVPGGRIKPKAERNAIFCRNLGMYCQYVNPPPKN